MSTRGRIPAEAAFKLPSKHACEKVGHNRHNFSYSSSATEVLRGLRPLPPALLPRLIFRLAWSCPSSSSIDTHKEGRCGGFPLERQDSLSLLFSPCPCPRSGIDGARGASAWFCDAPQPIGDQKYGPLPSPLFHSRWMLHRTRRGFAFIPFFHFWKCSQG